MATSGPGLLALVRLMIVMMEKRMTELMADLKFRLVMQSSIVGLVTKPETSTQISDVTCPFELPANSV